jgi:hypothetical protein
VGLLIDPYRFSAGVPAGPTRFYLEASGSTAAAVSPATDASWHDATSLLERLATSPTKAGTTLANKAGNASATGLADRNVLHMQYVSAPLVGDQTISGTVKGIIRGAEANLAANMRTQLVIRVCSNDGSTFRGTLRASDSEALASEFTTTHTTRKIPMAWTSPGETLTPVDALNGDRLVFEIGIRKHGSSGSYWATMLFGSSSGSDFAEDETQTTTLNPWLEFSQGLAF